eukprot:TRINITY_DN1133_c0_g6_i1.p1 TRINITY_DN1133_c0_g6~~TRINITY_DN1133_c0_g6_i1.p1  ORF type:complete len:781 (+),score=28.07 TRINITY_DN1133_c0_g6_i1:46-2388(+)
MEDSWVVHTADDKKVFSWANLLTMQSVHGVILEGGDEERKRRELDFVNRKDGKTHTILVNKIYVEALCLPQLRLQCKTERGMRNCIGRLVELLKSAENGCIGICWAEEHFLTSRRGDPYPAVQHLLKHLKGDPYYRGYDLVFTKREHHDIARITHVRKSLETELEKLRWETGPFQESTWFTYPLESRLLGYKNLVTNLLSEMESGTRPSDFETARNIWEWCLRYALFDQCSPEPIMDGNALLERATQILCGSDIPDTNGPSGFPYNKSDLPTEPAGGNFWRLNEAFGLPDPAKRKRSGQHDPCVLINTDSSCWLNSALIPLRESGVFRRLLFDIRPYKTEWSDALKNFAEDDAANAPLNKIAVKFVHRLQSLFAFMSPVGEHKYAFNPHVREAVEEFRHLQTGGYAGASSDASEFLGVLPDVIQSALKCHPSSETLSKEIDDIFYCRTKSKNLRGEDSTDEDDSGRAEYPLMTDGGGDLEVKLLRTLETGSHSLQYFVKTPKLLSIVIRRKLWDKKKNKPYISKEPVRIPQHLCLDALYGDETCLETRRKLMTAEQLISDLEAYDPSVQLRVAPNPMPDCLTSEVGDGAIADLQDHLQKLSESVAAVQLKRDALLAKEKSTAAELLSELTGRLNSSGNENYRLFAVIVYSDAYRGHYWSYVDCGGKWLRCDDKAEFGELPTFEECSVEEALESASTTASCVLYEKKDRAGVDPYAEDALPPHLRARVEQDNAKLAHYISRMPDVEFEPQTSSSSFHHETTYEEDAESGCSGISSDDYARY